MKINLHVHSKYSLDGELTVNELIELLKNKDFNVISITDHNTCEAYRSINSVDEIKMITGLEADAIVNDYTYDFLCYGFDLENVYNYVISKYSSVEIRQKKIFDALVEMFYLNKIELNDIDSYDSSNEYAHSAIYRMLDNAFLEKYNILSGGDFYRLSTTDKSFVLYIDMHIVWPDIKELSEIIHNNNGKIFLAHPFRYNMPVVDVLNNVKNYVDGIEICNNPKNREEVEFLYDFAKKNDLLVSCGSDYHGNDRYGTECDFLTEEMIQDMLIWIRSYILWI